MRILNKESGVYGMSGGLSSDFRDLWKGAEAGDGRAETAIESFCYRVAKYVGAYAAAMNGVDAVAFTAGVGENDYRVRERICGYLGYLGAEVDREANGKRGEEVVISTPGSRVKLLVVPTNEELAIARETLGLLRR